MLYELLTGEHPFRGQQYRDVLDRIKTLDPRPPRMLAGDISKELERICLKVDKLPSDRYHTALDLAEDLRHAHDQPRAMLVYHQRHKKAAEFIAQQLGQNGVEVAFTRRMGTKRSARTDAS